MLKMVIFAAVAVALMALSTAEGGNTLQLQCQRLLQESSLDACRQVVDHQRAIQLPFFHPRPSHLRSSGLRTGVRVQCCQQLQDISPECRAAAIHQIVRQYDYQAMAPLGGGSYYTRYYTGDGDDVAPYYTGEDVAPLGGGSYYPGKDKEQQGGGSYYPSETYQQQQEQESHRPIQSCGCQHQEQGSYRPSQTYLQKQQHEGGFDGEFTARLQQYGRHESFGSPGLRMLLRHGQQLAAQYQLDETAHQQEGQGQHCGRQSQQTGPGASSPSHHFGTEQHTARLRQLQVVARARQVAAQLPAMCFLDGTALSTSRY